MAKIDREAVYNKYGGHCSYCGREITLKEMQVDHKFPQFLSHWVKTGEKHKQLKDKYNVPDDINSFDNLMPSCRRCNHYKRADVLENFRDKMQTIHKRVEKQYITKVAIDYGIVEIKPWDGIFYFEKL